MAVTALVTAPVAAAVTVRSAPLLEVNDAVFVVIVGAGILDVVGLTTVQLASWAKGAVLTADV